MHVQNFSLKWYIKDILKKKNDVHWIPDGTVDISYICLNDKTTLLAKVRYIY